MPGTLFVVATPIGNLEDITARALRVLREVALIAAEDTRRTAHLLARYAITTPTTSLHEHNEGRKSSSLLSRLERGENIALVSDAGTPGISDPGRQLVRSAVAAGIKVEPVPGPSAVTAALAASGFPSDSFTFLGFPPTKPKERQTWLDQLRTAGRTVVFFEAPHRIVATLRDIQSVAGDVTVAIGRELTKAHEELVINQISAVIDRLTEPRGEFTIVVDIGQTTDLGRQEPISDADMLAQFGEITENTAVHRRKAIAVLARRHRRPANEIYAAVERAKKLVKR